MDYQHCHRASLKYIQNNLEYLILNMIHLVSQTLHATLEQIFSIYYYCMSPLDFSTYNKY